MTSRPTRHFLLNRRSWSVCSYIVMALYSYGLYTYGLHSYGLYSYGVCSCGLCAYGPIWLPVESSLVICVFRRRIARFIVLSAVAGAGHGDNARTAALVLHGSLVTHTRWYGSTWARLSSGTRSDRAAAAVGAVLSMKSCCATRE